MSVIKLELTKEHLALVKNLKVQTEPDEIGTIPKFSNQSPFGGDNVYDDVYTIVYGKIPNFDPLSDDAYEYTEAEIAKMDKLIKELPIALDIVLYFTGEVVTPGTYKTKYHLRLWKKIN